jgi:hypothetical protein
MAVLYSTKTAEEDRGDLIVVPDEVNPAQQAIRYIERYYPDAPDCAKSKIFAEEVHSFDFNEDYERR